MPRETTEFLIMVVSIRYIAAQSLNFVQLVWNHMTIDRDGSRCWPKHSGQHTDCSCLASTVWTQEAKYLGWGSLQTKAIDSDEFAKLHLQMTDVYHCLVSCPLTEGFMTPVRQGTEKCRIKQNCVR